MVAILNWVKYGEKCNVCVVVRSNAGPLDVRFDHRISEHFFSQGLVSQLLCVGCVHFLEF